MKRYFEDLRVGDRSCSPSHVVDRDHMLAFAGRYDPQYFHADPEEAQRSIFGEVIASGIYTMAIWRFLDHQMAADIAWICGVAWDDVRFPVAVRAGDTLRAEAEVERKRKSRSEPGRGVVTMRYRVRNQEGHTVFHALSTNLIEMRPAQEPQADSGTSIEELPKS